MCPVSQHRLRPAHCRLKSSFLPHNWTPAAILWWRVGDGGSWGSCRSSGSPEFSLFPPGCGFAVGLILLLLLHNTFAPNGNRKDFFPTQTFLPVLCLWRPKQIGGFLEGSWDLTLTTSAVLFGRSLTLEAVSFYQRCPTLTIFPMPISADLKWNKYLHFRPSVS